MLLFKSIGLKVYKSLCVYLLISESELLLCLMALMCSKLPAQHPCISAPQPVDIHFVDIHMLQALFAYRSG